jgi:hypothetical protein
MFRNSIISNPDVGIVSEIIEHVPIILELILGNALQYELAILRAGKTSAAKVWELLENTHLAR